VHAYDAKNNQRIICFYDLSTVKGKILSLVFRFHPGENGKIASGNLFVKVFYDFHELVFF
jgi:hypothetical protein